MKQMEMPKSSVDLAIIIAYKKGYYVINGIVYNKNNMALKLINSSNYLRFGVRVSKEKTKHIPVHRYVAYFKYGDKIFNKSLQVRHLDNDSLNNYESNIGIGTPSQNMMDKPKQLRVSVARNAVKHWQKYNHEDIIKMSKSGMSYEKIMKKTGITSKGTVSFIVCKSVLSNVE